MTGESFIDVDSCQQAKCGQVVAGDVFLSRRIKEEGRLITVLSDGLGSGVKAGVLANLTATMALRYTSAFVDVRQSAKTIMDTLPVCEQRKISYSTFTIVDLDEDGQTRVIEHGNPPLVLLRGATPVPITRVSLTMETWKDRVIHYSEFHTQLGDRIVFFSDGVSQSGLGRPGLPFAGDRSASPISCAGKLWRSTKLAPGNSPESWSPKPRATMRARPRTTSPVARSITAIRAGCWSSPVRPFARNATVNWRSGSGPLPAGRRFVAARPRALFPGCSTGRSR